jgi:hypothetical protein
MATASHRTIPSEKSPTIVGDTLKGNIMTLVAAYVLTSNTGQLSSDEKISADFHFGSLPANAQGGSCLLSFTITTSYFPTLQVKAILNDGPDIWGYFNPAENTDPRNTLQFRLQIGFNGLEYAPINNKITFKIVGGTGRMDINECVVWYQQNV